MASQAQTIREPSQVNIVQAISRRLQLALQTLLVPFLAIVTALLVGAFLILLAGRDPIASYQALVEGSILEPRGFIESLLKATPLILTGLAIGFAFKGGLFNIGAQGQLIMGSVTAAWIGSSDLGLPAWLHILLALVMGMVAGAFWGAIPGALKAYSGAHEVITTIMFNFIAGRIAEWLISNGSTQGNVIIPPGPLSDPNSGAIQRTRPVLESVRLPVTFSYPPFSNLNIGFFIAIAAAFLILVILNRTTFGFEIRMVGQNPNAARYAGINVKRQMILTMAIAGGLSGLAGVIQTLGVNGYYEGNQSLALGFDGITVSLLAANHPIGIVISAILFGFIDQGGTRMQGTGVPVDLTVMVQALILMFVAAPQIIFSIYRLRGVGTGQNLGNTAKS